MELRRGSSVLLIDDDPSDRALALNILRRIVALDAIAVCCDGVDAMRTLFSPDAEVDPVALRSLKVIILDLKMPRVDGFEVLRRIRADDRTKEIPVMIFSSSSEAADITRSYHLGANCYVSKPVNVEEFDRILTIAGSFWLTTNLVDNTSVVSHAISQ